MALERADPSRRAAFAAAGLLTAGAVLSLPGCARPASDADKPGQADVSAVDDLMREHGVLRRLLVVYRETAGVIRASAATLDIAALGQAADLFRSFGEDYHEKALEEAHIFPMVKKAGGRAASLIDTLIAQHRRGREINDYLTGLAKSGGVRTGQAEPLAQALESFARMYEIHAAIEDTEVFQAWRATLNAKELDAWSDKFEDIEHQTFKGDGFDLALEQVAGIEQRLGLSDLARYTAPSPPPT
ncbi:MAG TPA: hemerythrin domain-containing protein [Phenylobacterium sp.]|uniref:hemerythrin domain-containing protein n=1 Tax=Phenylobacterium sp. TaxID=1871053 RepID=UPI002C23C6BC|nr:hemerythrin domain-containing protein [Phenylobacterium sp.]HSV01802.1 hemerythrin domain-containing protein [Phenylobacterium sp.]